MEDEYEENNYEKTSYTMKSSSITVCDLGRIHSG